MVAQIKAWEPQADVPGGFADESALVAGLRAGRPEAFEALHAVYAGSIYALALRVVDDPHEAEDVAQEVLVKVFRGLPLEKGEFRLPAWLYRVTVNAAFDHVRARKRRPVAVAGDTLPEPASPVDEYARAELAQRVEATLRGLPKRQQLALVLRDLHGLSVGETASVLGVTRPSADVLLSRARAGFRKLYLAGTRVSGRCAEADRILAGGVGGGISRRDHAHLEEHAKTCPDCRHTVELWGIAPVGLVLLLPQVALPAKLSLGATLAAAKAAGVALPAGLGAAAAAGSAAGAGGTGAAAGSGAAAVTGAAASGAAATASVAGAAAATGASARLLEALGSAASIKIATLAAVATAALGITEVASHDSLSGRSGADAAAVTRSADGPGGQAVMPGRTPDAGGRDLIAAASAKGSMYAGLPAGRRQHSRAAENDRRHAGREAQARHGRPERGQGKSAAVRSAKGPAARRSSNGPASGHAAGARAGDVAAGSGSSRHAVAGAASGGPGSRDQGLGTGRARSGHESDGESGGDRDGGSQSAED